MRASRDAPGLLLLGLLCLTACGCTRRATQLLVVVDGDLRGPELGCVEVEVRRVEEPALVTNRRFHVTAEGEPRVTIPFSLGVTAPDGSPRRRVEVRALAFPAEGSGCAASPSVTRMVRTGFLAEQTLRLPMFLGRACVGVVCDGDRTCDGGECVLVPELDPGTLAIVRPGEELPDGGGARDDATVHTPLDRVSGPEPTLGDRLGDAVAISRDGTTLAIGVPDEDSSGRGIDPARDELAADSGAVLVYVRSGDGWALEAYVKAPNADAGDRFGTAVALSEGGDVLAVGAPREDGSGTGIGDPLEDEAAPESGAVYVYRRIAGVWALEAYVKASNAAAGHLFGQSVALSGGAEVLWVGAPAEPSSRGGIDPATTDGSGAGAGAAYVYEHDGARWRFESYVKAPVPGIGDQFGFVLAVSRTGDTAAIGARQEESSGAAIDPPHDDLLPDSGAVYVLRRGAGGWAYEATLKAHVPGMEDLFGFSVALSDDGDVLAAGAIREDTSASGAYAVVDEAATDTGAVYVFERVGTAWAFDAFLKAELAASDARLGYALAVSGAGDRIAVSEWPEVGAPSVTSFSGEGALWRVGARTPVDAVGSETPRLPVSLALSGDGLTLVIGVPDGEGAGVVEIHSRW